MYLPTLLADFLLENRCLPLLREHNKRGELVSLLIEAGDSAWARGAHEVRCLSSVILA